MVEVYNIRVFGISNQYFVIVLERHFLSYGTHTLFITIYVCSRSEGPKPKGKTPKHNALCTFAITGTKVNNLWECQNLFGGR